MQNNDKEILNILMSDKEIAEKFGKLVSGQYLTDRERKDLAKAIVDRWSELAKMNTQLEIAKHNIENQANVMKAWIENLKEVNF